METRSKKKHRHTEALAAIELQPTVVMEICKHLPSLVDIVTLAQCSKKLYARVNQCYPELGIMRRHLPSRARYPGKDGGMTRKCWFGAEWPEAFYEFLELPVLHHVAFRYCCECMLYASVRRSDLDTLCMHLRLKMVVRKLYEAQRWDLLDVFVVHVATWKRASTDGYGVWTISPTNALPEVIVAWGLIAELSIRSSNMVWLRRAMAALRRYWLLADEYGSEWYEAAMPHVTDPAGYQIMWTNFDDWCRDSLFHRFHGAVPEPNEHTKEIYFLIRGLTKREAYI
jgi:hypothetical protein